MENQLLKTNLEIIRYIIQQETKDKVDWNIWPGGGNEDKFLVNCFYNPKHSSRLTEIGFQYVSRWFKTINIELTFEGKIKSKHLLYLSRNLRTPYHLSHRGKNLYLFDDEDAIELILLNGDLDQYVRIHK